VDLYNFVDVQEFNGGAEGVTDRSSKQAAVEFTAKLRIGLNPGKGHFSWEPWENNSLDE